MKTTRRNGVVDKQQAVTNAQEHHVSLIHWPKNRLLHLDAVGYILIGIVLFCVFQIIYLAIAYQAKDHWIRVNAVVMDVAPKTLGRSGPPGKTPLLQVTVGEMHYKYWVQGTSYQGFGLSSIDRYDRYSRPLIVMYNPKNPTQSVIDTGTPWGLISVFGIGIIAAMLALTAWQFMHFHYEKNR